MKHRHTARRIALDVLYEAEIRDSLPSQAFEARERDGWVVAVGDEDVIGPPSEVTPEALQYGRKLVDGLLVTHAEIDGLLVTHADRWAIDRMPVVDRTILRLAVFELLWGGDVPVPVAINEAVELAKELSTEDSGRFVNGLLGRIAEELPDADLPSH